MSIDALMSRLNPLIGAWLRVPLLHWVLSPGLMLITVVGRRSGCRYTIPVGYQLDPGGQVVIVGVSEARKKQWWRNYLEPRTIEIQLRGRRRDGKAEVIDPLSDEFRVRAEATLRRVPGMARVFGVSAFDRKSGLSPDQVAHLGREIALVRIVLAS
jgi:deazaflavin-dependent oxidoreductase (nitroreductase family)